MAVRPLEASDLQACHDLYDEIGWSDPRLGAAENLALRRDWLDWTVRSYDQLAALHQPPYGERAITDSDQGFVGLVGTVPRLEPFGRLPGLGGRPDARRTPEVGLFWAVRPAFQGRGYATAAAGLVSAWLFDTMGLARILAGTEADNAASIGVMRRLGMRIELNPGPPSPGFDVTGVLEAPQAPPL
ncbi:GNAT family N-acetyltransferase [Phenylobacterium sp.]|uniref:GNAT family N-acetyltransferase n=1 Tax=Phenylobacterium sp. TaxID=1871053 RepID=UPI00272F67C2|nr:GNAT family N-acetyltransferase [Phenylobacterium sp.]MDP1616672.1 GNAT family N-acetyltransferase [Phenylobacterium sp.]MDP1985630.1 GNAT family N-acetyltransferase [Phenylobacterium sp.]